ncbi:MAG: hypothetical protein KDC98_24850, partial [Planctomycetes bacterium]|nr:hypothetical protein [Planctomycetota bacterium]
MNDRDAIAVVPPHGPLAWLFPELLRHDTTASGDCIDMRQGHDVEAVLAAAGDRLLRVQRGPRGLAVATALRTARRRAGAADPKVELSLLGAPCWEERLVELSRPLARSAFDVDLEAARELDGVPFFATEARHPSGEVHTRLASGWWGLLPGDRWPEPARRAWHTHLQSTRPDRVLRALAFENHALAGIDLFTESISRGDRLPRTAPRARPLVIGIDGIDGAGKSTHLDLLQSWLEQQGLVVRRHKLYRHGVFHDTVTDMTRACADGRALHLWPLQRHVKLMDTLKYWHTDVAPDLAHADVLLFDRYIETHLAAGAGRYHHDPYAREMLAVFPDADAVFVLDLPVETALLRLRDRPTLTVDENPYMLA